MMDISLVVDSQQKSIMAVFLTDALSVLQAKQHIATSSKSCATTLQQLQSCPSVDTHPVRSSNVHKQSNQVIMWATEKMQSLPKLSWWQVKRKMPTTFLVGQS